MVNLPQGKDVGDTSRVPGLSIPEDPPSKIKGVDVPIERTIARINAILERDFPRSDISTCSSCSGHILAQDDELAEPQMNTRDDPHVWIAAPDKTSSSSQRERMKILMSNVFQRAVERVNLSIGQRVLLFTESMSETPQYFIISGIVYDDEYLYRLGVQFIGKEEFRVIQMFWNFVEEELSVLDGISKITATVPRDFMEKTGRKL